MMDPLEHLQMLKDRAAGIRPVSADLARVRALRFTEPGFSRDEWSARCASGALAPQMPREFCAMAEQLGADLAPEPLIEAAMAARLLPPELLPEVLSGSRIVLPAWQEDAGSMTTVGDTTLQDGRLNGRKQGIPMAAGADAFLVSVPDGLALVERSAAGVSLEIEPTQDGGHRGTLLLRDAPSEVVAGDAAEALEQAIVGHAAYLLGVADRAFAITLDHIKATDAFGRRTPGLRALQHRADDMPVQLSLTRGAVDAAAQALETGTAKRDAAVSRAWLRAVDCALVVTRTCGQLYGGIGLNDAYAVTLYYRKAMVLARAYGSSAVHRRRFIRS